jgi:hypothetical protein
VRRKFDPLSAIKAAQRADAERFAGELTHGWFWRQLHAWTRRFDKLGKRVESLLKFGTALAAFLGVSAKVWHYIADRRIAPAELPAQGEPTIATDHVEKPAPPKP